MVSLDGRSEVARWIGQRVSQLVAKLHVRAKDHCVLAGGRRWQLAQSHT